MATDLFAFVLQVINPLFKEETYLQLLTVTGILKMVIFQNGEMDKQNKNSQEEIHWCEVRVLTIGRA